MHAVPSACGRHADDGCRAGAPAVRPARTGLAAGGAQFVAFRRMNEHTIVRVGALPGAITGLLVRALPAFGESNPQILIELREADAAHTSGLISNREASERMAF